MSYVVRLDRNPGEGTSLWKECFKSRCAANMPSSDGNKTYPGIDLLNQLVYKYEITLLEISNPFMTLPRGAELS